MNMLVLSGLLMSCYMFMTMKHPLYLSLVLILSVSTLGVALLNSGLTWFALAILMLYLGGMMVVFIYMVSIKTKEKFPKVFHKLPLSMVFFATVAWGLTEGWVATIQPTSPSYLYVGSSEMCLTFMGWYLILVLIIAVKLSNFNAGPLKC